MSWFAGSGYGQVISTYIPKLEVALAMTPLIIVPFIIFAGFLVNQSKVPAFYAPFIYIDIIKYNYQAAEQNEFSGLQLSCMISNPPTCDPLGVQDFKQGITLSIIILGVIAIATRIIAFIGLYIFSKPKKAKILRTNFGIESEKNVDQLN